MTSETFDRHLSRLRKKAPAATQLLIDLIASDIIPLLLQAGFLPSPEAVGLTTNQFGLIWGSNDLAFQDRSVTSWPTIVVAINRELAPYVVVELCEIPQEPIMIDGTRLPREQANHAHSLREFRLRKGLRDNYKDHEFGASFWSFRKSDAVRREIAACKSILGRVVVLPRSTFVTSLEQTLGAKFLHKSWDEHDELRPNRSLR